MYLIILLCLTLLIRFSEIENYGFNKTVGWAYDFSGFTMYYVKYIVFAFFIGYLFLAIIKAKTNYILSIIHFILIAFCCLFFDNVRYIRIVDTIAIIGIVVYVVIFLNALFWKMKT
ncbi:hypothetical protein H9X57_09080 [Flavobacterium piscinae]|uniref:Uncharacterized protein n=1 Tax=Flavobacterium piscinae TaxID=2506424 RepID=A0A4Q1KWK9_9FLAO|nr:hypothetical protein [Flavobacterium piscinae]MBC8883488.1 hypothetical protein [Flavobacterium piscinae]RXR34070.1 hypothetical protein EQG68_03275 [Flavobacterium piscinae]